MADINEVDSDGNRIYDDKGNYIPKGKRTKTVCMDLYDGAFSHICDANRVFARPEKIPAAKFFQQNITPLIKKSVNSLLSAEGAYDEGVFNCGWNKYVSSAIRDDIGKAIKELEQLPTTYGNLEYAIGAHVYQKARRITSKLVKDVARKTKKL